MLALFANARQDQHHDGNHVRKHLDQLFLRGRDVGKDEGYNIASAEQNRAQNTDVGLPKDKDDQGNCQPAKSFNGCGCR